MKILSAMLAVLIAALTLTPLAEARGHGYSHSYRSHAPREHSYRSYTPREHSYRSYAPREHSYRSYAPRTLGSYPASSAAGHWSYHRPANWLDKFSRYSGGSRSEHRSAEEKHSFWQLSGFPHGRPGYVVDHIKPLACGGADAPSNMQWQTIAAGKAKDKTERIGCGHGRSRR